jgi:hypothetical protein
VFAHGYGREPVAWLPPGQRTFNLTAYAWQEVSFVDMAAVLARYFGQVDELVLNVGMWHFHSKVGEWMRNITSGSVAGVTSDFRAFEKVVKSVNAVRCPSLHGLQVWTGSRDCVFSRGTKACD